MGEDKKHVSITEAFGEPFYLPKADRPGLESLRGAASTRDDSLTWATVSPWSTWTGQASGGTEWGSEHRSSCAPRAPWGTVVPPRLLYQLLHLSWRWCFHQDWPLLPPGRAGGGGWQAINDHSQRPGKSFLRSQLREARGGGELRWQFCVPSLFPNLFYVLKGTRRMWHEAFSTTTTTVLPASSDLSLGFPLPQDMGDADRDHRPPWHRPATSFLPAPGSHRCPSNSPGPPEPPCSRDPSYTF